MRHGVAVMKHFVLESSLNESLRVHWKQLVTVGIKSKTRHISTCQVAHATIIQFRFLHIQSLAKVLILEQYILYFFLVVSDGIYWIFQCHGSYLKNGTS